jgi:uncharacterized SAM-binding protein YcdF (DUF218 family)
MKALAIILIAGLVWAAGLLAFAARVAQSTPPDEPDPAQGIVVLTGHAGTRIQAAARLLEQGKGGKLLVSGVNQKVSRADILTVSKSSKPLYDCCVQLGFQAADTKGNAREIAAWTQHENFTSLIVVTADYHMPRAMLEIRGSLPAVLLTPYPVKTDEVDADSWWKTSLGARRMSLEYCKYLAVLARETILKLGPHSASSKAAPPLKMEGS